MKADTNSEMIDPVLYQPAVGSLMTKTHPDIVSIVNSVARFGSQPTNAWVATKRIFI